MSEYNKRKYESHSVPVYNKRPYYGDVRPGQEYQEPRLYQQPNLSYDRDGQQKSTDFSKWSEAEIKSFLDERGGDFDDCTNFHQLIERAIETEINTGPARRPGSAGNGAAAAAAAAAANDDDDEYDFEAIAEGQKAPAAAASAAATTASTPGADDEYDPLEAFMAEINQEVAENKPNKPSGAQEAAACDEAADPATEYMAVRAARGATSAAAIAANIAAAGYDSDEEVYATAKALAEAEGGGDDSDDDTKAAAQKHRTIEPLAPVDHSLIEYDDFAKDFYTENPAIAAMTEQQVKEYRRELQVHVSGFDPPRPIQTFGQAGFDHLLLGAIKKAGYDKPTAIQAQSLPAVLSGRDVLGLAKTGSGKTAAFVLPMLVHIMDQPEVEKGGGPIGLVLAPTRELAEQIHKETRKFSKPYGLRAVAAFGGLSKFEQFKQLKAGCEIAVATPGRMMDLVKAKACTTRRVTYLVLDEADRMFDMGFEQQVRSLIAAAHPDHQTLLFSATLPRRIESLVAEALNDPVRISVGLLGAANQDVTQKVEVMKSDADKLSWLSAHLPGFIDDGDVLMFVGQRAKCEEVTAALTAAGFKAAAIHGDMDQFSRMAVLDSFRSGQQHLLVATDVAARGLDIKTIKTVINYDAARDIDTHIHRVGRTGRAGDKEGVAITLLLDGTNRDQHFAGLLVNSLTLAGQEVPRSLYSLAVKDGRFRKGSSRHKGGKGGKGGRRKGPQVGGAGLGFGPKPQQNQTSNPEGYSGSGLRGEDSAGGFVQLSGFARSHEDYEHESSAAAAAAAPTQQQQQQQQLPMKFPPPPPLPSGEPPLPPGEPPGAAAAVVGNAGVLPAPPLPAHPPIPGGSHADAAAAAAATYSASWQQQQQPLTAAANADEYDPTAAAAVAASDDDRSSMQAARKELLQTAYAGRLKSSFVSSGVRGGDIGQAATILAPKKAPSSSIVMPASAAAGGRPAFRPPVPVTERPMYLTRPTETITRGGRGAPLRSLQQQQRPAVSLQSNAAQQAIAAAQAVAARLAAQAAGVPAAAAAMGDPQGVAAAAAAAGGSYQPPYQQQQQFAPAPPAAAAGWGPPPAAAAGWGPPPAAAAGWGPSPAAAEYGLQQQQQQPGSSVADAVAAAQAVAARLAAQHPGG